MFLTRLLFSVLIYVSYTQGAPLGFCRNVADAKKVLCTFKHRRYLRPLLSRKHDLGQL